MTCGVCGTELPTILDPMVPPIPLGRIRICVRCNRVVCRRHSKRVAGHEFLCTECAAQGDVRP